ncbi:OmpA family protein [Sessilibacter sp. MAH1]
MIKKHFLANSIKAAIASTVFATAAVYADDYNEGLTFTPGLGYYFFDSSNELEDDSLYSISVGYQFNNPWAIEFVYLNADTESDIPFIGDVDVDQFRLDGLYHFARNGNWQPYLAGGIGDIDFDATRFNVSEDDTTLNFGGGVKYYLTDAIALRPDVRVIHGIDENFQDVAFTLGLNFLLGGSSSSSKVAKPAPVQPEPQEAAAPADSDNDGVIDTRDQCPNTPAGVRVDSIGCALDSDNDGVADYKDACPDTEASAKVDARGCYIELTEDKTVDLSVRFANNSAVVEPEFYSEIETVAKFMREYATSDVVIEGHTDDRGSAAYNQQLSERRAKAVAEVLVSQFNINANRVSAVGYGEARPIAPNDDANNRALNRRVVAVVKASVTTRVKK